MTQRDQHTAPRHTHAKPTPRRAADSDIQIPMGRSSMPNNAAKKPTPRRTASKRAKRNDEPTVRGRVPFAQGHVSMAQVQDSLLKRRKAIGIIGLVILCVIVLVIFHSAEQGKFDAAREKAAQGDYAAAQTAFTTVAGIPLLAFPEASQMAAECQNAIDAKAAAEKGNYQAAVDLYDKIDLLKKETGRDRCLAKANLAAENEEWITLAKNILAITKADYEYDYCDNPANETEREIAIRRKSNSTEVRGKNAAGKMLTLEITVPSDDKELIKLAELMKNGIAYDTAKRWYDEGDFANAAVTFEKLGTFRDASTYTAKSYDAAYQQASDLAAKGEYFKARTAFTTIGSYKDAQARAEECVQPLPENGAFNTGNGPDCAITISVPESGQPTYVRFYDANGAPCGSVFIHPGNQAVVNLLGGSYYLKTASGTDWYGEVDLFGDTGTYQQMSYGTAGMFPLDTGATYNLTVGGQSGGNISTTTLESAEDLDSAK